MACTWAVGSLVTEHLASQLTYLESRDDKAAYAAVASMLDDEKNDRGLGLRGGGAKALCLPLRFYIGLFAEATIRFGML